MSVFEAQKKLTFEKEDHGGPEAGLDGVDQEKSEIEHFNVTIKTYLKLPQVDPGKAKFQSNSADCFTNISADSSLMPNFRNSGFWNFELKNLLQLQFHFQCLLHFATILV